MKTVFQIALNDLRVFFAERENLVGLVALPLLFTFILGFINPGGGQSVPQSLRVDLHDLDDSAASQALVEALMASNEALYFCPGQAEDHDCGLPEGQTLSVDISRQRVLDGQTSALIIIPAGFEAALSQLQPTQINYASQANLASGDPVAAALDAAVGRINQAQTAVLVAIEAGQDFPGGTIFSDVADKEAFGQEVATRANELLAAEVVRIESITLEGDAAPEVTGFNQSVPGMGSMFVMFTVFGAVLILAKERKTWTLQRLVMMPIRKSQLLGGKILAYFALGMIQYGVVFGVGLVVGMYFGSDALGLLLVMVAFTLCVTALAFFMATLVHNEAQANGISLLLSLTLAPLGGAWWPLEITPAFMQVVGRISPVSWAMDGFNQLFYYGGTVFTIWPVLLVLVGAAGGLFLLAVRGFRYED